MSCAEVLEAIARGEDRHPGVAGHLEICAECRERAESARSLGHHLADPLLWEDPSPEVLDRVLSTIRSPETDERGRPGWRILAAVAGLALVVAIGTSLGRQPDWVTDLAPGPAAPQATATVSGWNEDHGTRMRIEVTGLDPTGPDAYYELWLTAPDGRHVSAGTFRNSGRFEVMAGVRRADYPRIWVTMEPADDDPAPFPMTVLDMPEA